MGYTVKTIDGELKEYAFDLGGVIALRNFTATTNGNRLIVKSTQNANFTILDALVNEVEIDGVVYDNVTAAQEALQRLVFNPAVPVILTQAERDKIGKGLQKDISLNLTANTPLAYTPPINCRLWAFEFTVTTPYFKVGTATGLDDLGSITNADAEEWLELSLKNRQIYIESSTAVKVIPIIIKF